MKKLKFTSFLALFTVILVMLPSMAMATTYNNDVPSGSTLLAWSVTPNNNGKHTTINFLYSGGFSAADGIDAPFDSSWHSLDDVRPILLAEQEGYGNYLGGTNGSFGSNIKFSDNVLAAMKAQNFNPSQVGGANIPPSSTNLNADQTAWLQKMGYTVPSSNQTVPKPAPSPTPAPTQTQSTSSKQSSSTASTPVQTSNNESLASVVQSKPAVGETVKTPSGPITPEMVADDQKMAAQNPPSLNPTNIPTKVPASTDTSSSPGKKQWVWAAGGAVVLVVGAVVGLLIKKRRKISA